MKLNRVKLLQKSGGDENKLQILLQSDESGLQLGQSEQKMEKLLYQVRKQYSSKVNGIIFFCVFGWPLVAGLLSWILMLRRERRKRKQIREMFDE